MRLKQILNGTVKASDMEKDFIEASVKLMVKTIKTTEKGRGKQSQILRLMAAQLSAE